MTSAQKEKPLDVIPRNSRANDNLKLSAISKAFVFCCLAPLAGQCRGPGGGRAAGT